MAHVPDEIIFPLSQGSTIVFNETETFGLGPVSTSVTQQTSSELISQINSGPPGHMHIAPLSTPIPTQLIQSSSPETSSIFLSPPSISLTFIQVPQSNSPETSSTFFPPLSISPTPTRVPESSSTEEISTFSSLSITPTVTPTRVTQSSSTKTSSTFSPFSISPTTTVNSTSSTARVGPIIGGVVGGLGLMVMIMTVIIIKRRRCHRGQAGPIPTINPLLENPRAPELAAQHDISSSKESPGFIPRSTHTSSPNQNQTTPYREPALSLQEVESAIQRQMEMISERIMALENAQSPPEYASQASE
ncbi:hypothetical protein E4T56_gene14211 [Termitomyces sp. T112]|nr:hypothetical protein E4T56_gene14211 [Termitomyces sp. T112]